MNKKAFTLLEMITVVTIIACILLLIVPIINKNIKKTNVLATTIQKENLENAAYLYAINYESELSNLYTNGSEIITLDKLYNIGIIDKKLITVGKKTLPLTNTILLVLINNEVKTYYDINQENKNVIFINNIGETSIAKNTIYQEMGAKVYLKDSQTIIDIPDENITNNINKSVLGDYYVTYSYSNADEVKLKVSVVD